MYYGDTHDRHGAPRMAIRNLSWEIRQLADMPEVEYEVEAHRDNRGGAADGCFVLHAGLLRPMQLSLARIVETDPDLLQATLGGGYR